MALPLRTGAPPCGAPSADFGAPQANFEQTAHHESHSVWAAALRGCPEAPSAPQSRLTTGASIRTLSAHRHCLCVGVSRSLPHLAAARAGPVCAPGRATALVLRPGVLARRLQTRLNVKPRTGPPKTAVGAMGFHGGGWDPRLCNIGASRFLRMISARSCLAQIESISFLVRSSLILSCASTVRNSVACTPQARAERAGGEKPAGQVAALVAPQRAAIRDSRAARAAFAPSRRLHIRVLLRTIYVCRPASSFEAAQLLFFAEQFLAT
jgi:hypothetical protein